MSASLVGSEMCIRDRPSPAALTIRTSQLFTRTCAPLNERGGLDIDGEPVSYTHLTLPTICSV
eukprot:3270285-Alexandrium_andersonii.AAC.1